MRGGIRNLASMLAPMVAALAAAQPAGAFVALSGTFEATRDCPASRRIAGAGDLRVEPGKLYRLLGKNREAATHYRIRVGTSAASDRWVAVGCGTTTATQDRAATIAPGPKRYVLAVSWQSAFCETRPGKPECRTMTARRFDATHFTLHGLWPQPRGNEYCNIPPRVRALDRRDGGWPSLPALALSATTRARLERAMPGTMSYLHRHEWVRHGSCYGAPADRYFTDALDLLDQLNASELRRLFVANIGKLLRLSAIRAALETSFGAGTGRRVNMVCKRDGRRVLIAELRLSLAGTVGTPPSLAALMAGAPNVTSDCGEGIVDPVGRQ